MRNKKGFTLIELLVVIAIIGLLSTLAVVSLNSARQKARDAARKSDLNAIATAMEMYRANNDSYPGQGTCAASGATSTIIAVSGTLPQNACETYGGLADSSGTILAKIPKDPGNSHYVFSVLTSTNYTLTATLEGGGTFVCTSGSCQ